MATSLTEALKALPADAKWSCSFGNPGEGGYTEYHRTPAGERWIVSNGPYYLHPFQFDWHCQKVEG
ncbi:MAG TPA: hypothetical protein VL614_15170 [Acetobacteraceae bacterium]|jgi:hypothetical protein|nr:hypothetical protein [Acetobacteraceae bacterium]